MHFLVLFAIIILAVQTNGQFEGQKCTKNNLVGVCTRLSHCRTAREDIIFHRGSPKPCSFPGIICCLDNVEQTTTPTYQSPVATTIKIRTTSAKEYVPPSYDYVLNGKKTLAEDGCKPILANMTAAKTGQKAWDKCIEYQQKLVYPCERSVALSGRKVRGNRCHHQATQLIVGGIDSTTAEFPHMVLLGLAKDTKVSWSCGGTLISDRFIMTANHCTSSKIYGKVRYARTGVLKRTDTIDPQRLHKIIDVIKHYDHNPPSRYNDIALLKTDREILLDEFAVPACLDVGSSNNYERALATGWGATSERGPTADQLQRVALEKFSSSECSQMFQPNHRMLRGFDERTQICYGDKNEKRDTCQGDSGGPLQLYHKQIDCMYTVVGITSFGRKCANVGEPGLYTRVSSYVPWIESIVWP